MKKIENPAERLHDLLVKGKSMPGNVKCKDNWIALLALSEPTEANVLRGIAAVSELPQKILYIRDELIKSKRGRSQHWLRQVNSAFSEQTLTSDWSTFTRHIDDVTISELDFLAMVFEGANQEEGLNEEELLSFKQRILELREEVLNSDIDQDVRFAIVELLKKTLEAIELYQLTGAGPIMEAVELSVGKIMFNEKLQEEVKTGTVGKKLAGIMGGLASIVVVAQGIKEIAPPVISFLGKINY
ncbi:TPA: hypothetical protein ACSTL5_004609 [Serratia fonticola]